MNLARLLLALLVAVLAPGVASGAEWLSPVARDHPLVGRLWAPDQGRFMAEEEGIARAAAAHHVLLGEKHDNADHHRLQARVIGALAAAGRRPAIALEMLAADQMSALAAHLAAAPGDAAGLGAALGWAERGWPDWALYRPVADAALAARLPLVAADLPRSWIRQPPTFLRQRVLLDVAWGAPLAVALEAELVEAHCGMLPAAALPRMVQAQRARDGHMADRMLAATAAGAGGTVLIAGAGHVRRDRGVPWYLARRDGDISAFVIAFVEVIGGLNDPAAYAEVAPEGPPPFDLLWFTPRVDDRDPCAAHREQLERVKTAG